MVSRSPRSRLSTARRMSSVHAIAAPRPRLVLKIFAPLSPLPIGHCVSSFLAIGGADPQISAFILRAAVLEASLAVVSTCCVRTVSPCVPLRCTNHKRTVRKRATAAIKQSCGRSTAFAKMSKRPPSSARAIAGFPAQERSRETPSAPKSDACDARELWCFAGCLSPILPPIAHPTRRGRRVYVPNVPLGSCRCVRFWAHAPHALPSKHIRAA